MLPSLRGVTASAPGVRSRTMTQNETTRDGIRELDVQAVVEPVLTEAFAMEAFAAQRRLSVDCVPTTDFVTQK